MSTIENTESTGGSGEIFDSTNRDAENVFDETEVLNEGKKKRGKSKEYELLYIYTSLEVVKQFLKNMPIFFLLYTYW
jgi:hypothetical protein